MDFDRNGVVDHEEFVAKLAALHIPQLNPSDFSHIFQTIDVNKDASISMNELEMFIKGAELNKLQRMQTMDPRLVNDLRNRIGELFNQLDDNGDGRLTANELQTAMRLLGRPI